MPARLPSGVGWRTRCVLLGALHPRARTLRPAADEATLRLHALKEEAVEKEHDRLLRLDKERARHEREAETERAGRSSLEERERGRREEEERRAREREARKQRRQGGDLTHEEELQLQQLEQVAIPGSGTCSAMFTAIFERLPSTPCRVASKALPDVAAFAKAPVSEAATRSAETLMASSDVVTSCNV